jgi:hypothetical protein
MSYAIAISLCLAYGLLFLRQIKRDRIELARRRRAYERRLMYEGMLKATENITRLVSAFALTGESAARASRSLREFADAWKFGDEMRERFRQ